MTNEPSAEQQARDLLDRLGMPDAQAMTTGDVVELANLIAEHRAYKSENAALRRNYLKETKELAEFADKAEGERDALKAQITHLEASRLALREQITALVDGGYVQHKSDCRRGKTKQLCPQCGNGLHRVVQGPNSMLNEYQFDAVKAGDYFCQFCTGKQSLGTSYRYWWARELAVEGCTCGLASLLSSPVSLSPQSDKS